MNVKDLQEVHNTIIRVQEMKACFDKYLSKIPLCPHSIFLFLNSRFIFLFLKGRINRQKERDIFLVHLLVSKERELGWPSQDPGAFPSNPAGREVSKVGVFCCPRHLSRELEQIYLYYLY